MFGPVQVFAVHQRDEFRVFQVVIPGEPHQPLQRGAGIEIVEIEPLLGGPDIEIGILQHGLEQTLFAFKIVVDHPLIGFRLFGNHIDPGAAKAVAGEFPFGGFKNAGSGGLGIADPDAGLRAGCGFPGGGFGL